MSEKAKAPRYQAEGSFVIKKISFHRETPALMGRRIIIGGGNGLNGDSSYRKGLPLLKGRASMGLGVRVNRPTWTLSVCIDDHDVRMAAMQQHYLGIEARLSTVLPGLVLARDEGTDRIGGFGSVPVQIEGSADGIESFYFRFRGNHASIRTQPVDASAQPQHGGDDDVYPTENDPNAVYSGSFESDDDLVACFARCVANLSNVDPITNPDHQMQLGAAVEAMIAAMGELPGDPNDPALDDYDR